LNTIGDANGGAGYVSTDGAVGAWKNDMALYLLDSVNGLIMRYTGLKWLFLSFQLIAVGCATSVMSAGVLLKLKAGNFVRAMRLTLPGMPDG
jgi:hypothetical protein